MPAAPLPPDEDRRLAALHRYLVLDSDREQSFDDLTAVAAAICGTPISLVSLLDRDRQWFKSAIGLPVRETPRSAAFCGHAILQEGVFQVPDAAADLRFADNPLVVEEPSVRFYAGAPLVDSDGHALGTLCVLDHRPRDPLTPAQHDALAALARQAVRLLELRQVAERFRALSENTSDCVFRFTLGDAPHLDYVSPAVTEMTGYTPQDLYDDPAVMSAVVHVDDQELLAQILDGRFPDEPVDIRLLHRDGHEVRAEYHVRTVRDADGKPIAAFGVTRDVTARHRAEEAVRAAHDKAQRANLAKDQLLSRVSHELRTPLNAVLGFAQLLELDVEGEQAVAVAQITTAGRHLLGIVDDVLSLSTPTSADDHDRCRPVGIVELALQATALLAPEAAARGVALHPPRSEEDICVHADAQRLTEAVVNLVSNAVKYNVPAGEVEVEVRLEGAEVVLSVRDTGPGLDEGDLARLFTPFDRLDAELRGIPGTGLGLVLARDAIEGMTGRLLVESTPGVGSTFSVVLPLAHLPCTCAGGLPVPVQRAVASDGGSQRVIYVEDNESNRTLVGRVLARRAGVELLLAGDGLTGLELVRTTQPALVLLDLHLPGMGGEAVLEALREDPALVDVPVVVLSADAMPDTVARVTALGAAAFLTKPLDIHELLRQIDLHLRPVLA